MESSTMFTVSRDSWCVWSLFIQVYVGEDPRKLEQIGIEPDYESFAVCRFQECLIDPRILKNFKNWSTAHSKNLVS